MQILYTRTLKLSDINSNIRVVPMFVIISHLIRTYIYDLSTCEIQHLSQTPH
jgi:hypothetical protein